MQASTLASRLRRNVAVRDWMWWELPPVMRCYVAAVPFVALVTIGVALAQTDWHVLDLTKFLVLVCCGAISVASTPRIMYSSGGLTRDFTTIWVLPTAVLLPPVYAALIPIPIYAILQLWVHRGVVHRTIFSAASVSLGYTAVSLVFRHFPSSIAGASVGSGRHALTWVIIVACCYVVGSRVHTFMVLFAIKLSDPKVKISGMVLDRDALQGLFVEIDLGVLITLVVALSPALVVVALPTVLLVRRFLVYPVLVAQSRVDAKTGLMNISAWEREAEAELSRSVRTKDPISVAIVDIDHFKQVNDTHGHLAGDRVLKAVATALKSQLRDYDRVGRFGGEEFVFLLAQSDEGDALRIAERLRTHIGALSVAVDDRPDAPSVQVTISVGVAAMGRGEHHHLSDLMSAADSALYQAKQTGRDRVCVSGVVQSAPFVTEVAGQIGSVRVDPASASLCPLR